jgi:hypothetical protein
MPDGLFRRAKARAAQRGIAFRQFVTEAVEAKLRSEADAGGRPWLALAGRLRRLSRENARIRALIEQEFETVEPEDRL